MKGKALPQIAERVMRGPRALCLAAREELRLFLTALQFFTRVPVPAWVGWSPAQLNASARHFCSVGLLIGALAGGVIVLGMRWWSASVAVLLSMACSVWLTGAFHEDGLADSCDGFGGGQSREQVLAIMKDSRVGSYATVGLALVLLLKFELLCSLAAGPRWRVVVASVAAHAASRFAALWVMARLPYVRDEPGAKSKPIAQGIAGVPLLFAGLLAAAPCAALGGDGVAGAAAVSLVAWRAVAYLRRRLGGYVGDALGATQQLAEVAFLLALSAWSPTWSFA